MHLFTCPTHNSGLKAKNFRPLANTFFTTDEDGSRSLGGRVRANAASHPQLISRSLSQFQNYGRLIASTRASQDAAELYHNEGLNVVMVLRLQVLSVIEVQPLLPCTILTTKKSWSCNSDVLNHRPRDENTTILREKA